MRVHERALGASLLSVMYAVALFHRTAAAVLAVAVAATLHIGLGEASGIATAFFWTYALLQLPCGIAADVIGSRRLAIAGCVITGMGSIAFAVAPTMTSIILARIVVAVGCSVTFVTLVRHIKENWPPARVATVSGRGILVGNVGAIASAAPLALLLPFIDWRLMSALLGVASIGVAAALYLLTREAPDRRRRSVTARGVSAELRAVFSNPYNHLGLLILAGLAGAYYALAGMWAIPMLQQKGLSAPAAAWVVSGMIAGYAIGACVLGSLGDRTHGRSRVLALACTGALALWGLLVSGMPLHAAALAGAMLALGFCCGAFNLVYAIVTERNPVEHAGTVTSYINVGIFAGAAVMNTFSTRLWITGGPFYETAMLPMTAGAVLALIGSLAMLARRHPRVGLIESKTFAAPAA